MNRRRVVTIVAAIVLTLFGTIVLIAYVNSAERRAREGAQLVGILVAAAEIPQGTPAADLAGSAQVARQEVPADFLADDAVSDLADLGDQVTTQPILAGEPLVARQFADEGTAAGGSGAIPEGREIISVALEPQRALGGEIAEGDLVGVIISIEGDGASGGGEATDVAASDAEGSGGGTAMVLAGVPVTRVGGVNADTGETGNAIMVSLEVDEPDAERIVYGAEFGRLWLTRQGEGETIDASRRTGDNIFSGLGR